MKFFEIQDVGSTVADSVLVLLPSGIFFHKSKFTLGGFFGWMITNLKLTFQLG